MQVGVPVVADGTRYPGVVPSPHDPFTPSAPTLRRGVSRGPHSSVFGAGPTPALPTEAPVVPAQAGTHPRPAVDTRVRSPPRNSRRPNYPLPTNHYPLKRRERNPSRGRAVATQPVHLKCPDASSGCIEGPHSSVFGAGPTPVLPTEAPVVPAQAGTHPLHAVDTPDRSPPRNSRRPNYPLPTNHYPLRSGVKRNPSRGGPSPHDPFTPSAPTLRRGVSRGPHSSVFGAGPSPVLPTAAPVVPAQAGTHPLHAVDTPDRSPPRNSRRPNYPLSTTKRRERNPSRGGAVATRPRSPRVPRRFVGVYRGARTAQSLGRGPTPVLPTEAPVVPAQAGTHPPHAVDTPDRSPPRNSQRPNYPLPTNHYPLRSGVNEVQAGEGPSPHDPFTPSAPTLRRGVSRGPHSSVFGAGPTPSIRDSVARALRYAPVEAPALLRVIGLCVPNSEQPPPGTVTVHVRGAT